jgi:mono/diheme cytochrome c family protein
VLPKIAGKSYRFLHPDWYNGGMETIEVTIDEVTIEMTYKQWKEWQEFANSLSDEQLLEIAQGVSTYKSLSLKYNAERGAR